MYFSADYRQTWATYLPSATSASHMGMLRVLLIFKPWRQTVIQTVMTTISSPRILVIINCGYFQVIQAVMFLTGAIGIKIAIAKILGIADDVSKLISFLLNSKNCYTEPLTHLWLLLLMALIAIHFCCLLKVFVPWRNVRSIFTTRGWDASAPFPLTLSDTFFLQLSFIYFGTHLIYSWVLRGSVRGTSLSNKHLYM